MRVAAVGLSLCAPAIACAAGGKSGEGGGMMTAVFQMMASLAVVLGIIYLLYYVFTRWFKGFAVGKARTGLIRVVETRYLAPKRQLMIVEVGGEYLLLGDGNEGVHLIKKLDNGAEFAPPDAALPPRPAPEVFRKTFDDVFKKMQEGIAVVKRRDFALKKILSFENQLEPITVEQMMERMQPQKSGSGFKQATNKLKAKILGETC
jgi:flagellar protein FliO/FliZ